MGVTVSTTFLRNLLGLKLRAADLGGLDDVESEAGAGLGVGSVSCCPSVNALEGLRVEGPPRSASSRLLEFLLTLNFRGGATSSAKAAFMILLGFDMAVMMKF